MEVEEWVFTGFGRQREQVCSEGWPRRLAGEFRDSVAGLAIEYLNNLGANQLLGRDMEPVGVVNRPGFGGGIDPTKGWSHVSTEEVSA
jgi:hypothetical protein